MKETTNRETIPIIIPSLEPDNHLLELLEELKNERIEPIIIVNDGSDTEYERIFETAKNSYNCIVLKHITNLGKGRALKTAFNYCLEKYPDMLGAVTADSDGQHTAESIKKCKSALMNNRKSLILGTRMFSGDDIPWKSKVGNYITRIIFNVFCGLKIHDTQTGLRGIPAELMLQSMHTSGERFEFETRMLLEANDNYEIIEVPIDTLYDSKDNHKTHFNPVKDSIRIYRIFFEKFLKFILSSLSSFVIDIVLFSLLCNILDDQLPITYISVATIIARCVSASYNYLINYAFVFNSSAKHITTITRYIVLAAIIMLLSALLTSLGVFMLPNVKEYCIKIVVDSFLFISSYLIQKKIIF